MKARRKGFALSDLIVVRHVDDIPGTKEPLHIGDQVRLNSGGPLMLVVDIAGDEVTAAWQEGSASAQEVTLPRPCLTLVAAI